MVGCDWCHSDTGRSGLDDTLKARLVPEYPAILRKLIDSCVTVYRSIQHGAGGLAIPCPCRSIHCDVRLLHRRGCNRRLVG